jgi:outer membrane immunogenic protein
MRKTTLLAGAALLLAGPAVAADLARPVYKAPAFVPGFTWTGCYAGGDVGGARGNQSGGTHTDGRPNVVREPVLDLAGAPVLVDMVPQTTLVPARQADTAGDFSRGSSVIGGAYVGCNYQFTSGLLPGLVAGVEGDFSWTDVNGSFEADNVVVPPKGIHVTSIPGGGGISMTSDTRWTASLRARLGYAVMPNVLVYGTAGRAWATTDYTGLDAFNTGGSVSTAFSNNGAGWVAGGGIEWAPWSNNWLLRAEYLHYDINGVSSTVGGTNPITQSKFATTFSFRELKLDTVRAGIAYKF